VVNKADREGADRVVQAIAANMSLQSIGPTDWQTPIVKTEATTGKGVADLWAAIGQFRERTADKRAGRRRTRQEARLRDLLAQRFLRYAEQTLPEGEFQRVVDRIASRELDPYSAAADLMRRALAKDRAR
jgi:LAO/AO transport system kinase